MLEFKTAFNSDLKIHARNFRKAILKIAPEDFCFELFSMFPHNCCEYTSYLLAKYLHDECGHKKIIMVHGENRYKKSTRHVWLKISQFDIDITANQFHSTNKTVFAEERSIWHRRFDIYESKRPDVKFDLFHKEPKMQLLADYRNIVSNIRT